MSDPVDRDVARTLLIKAKIYNGMSFVLLATAVLVCAILYIHYTDSNALILLRSPHLLFVLVMSFAPAAFFSWKARSIERKLRKMVYSAQEKKEGNAPPSPKEEDSGEAKD